MQNIKKILIFVLIFSTLSAPVVFAADFQGPCPAGTHNDGTGCVQDQPGGGGLVPCNNTPVIDSSGNVRLDSDGNVQYAQNQKCDFTALMGLVNTIISFILYGMALPISAIMFAYAGFLLVTSGEESAHAREKAKKIFMHAAVGLALAVAAWLIVKTVLSILGYTGASWLGF